MDEVRKLFDAACNQVGTDKYSNPPFNTAIKFELSDAQIAPAISELQKLLNERYPALNVSIELHRDSGELVVDFIPK